MPRITVEDRLQAEIEKYDAKIRKAEADKQEYQRERDKLVKAKAALAEQGQG